MHNISKLFEMWDKTQNWTDLGPLIKSLIWASTIVPKYPMGYNKYQLHCNTIIHTAVL